MLNQFAESQFENQEEEAEVYKVCKPESVSLNMPGLAHLFGK